MRLAAREAGLRHVSDDEPGIRRRRAGRAFAYRDDDGMPVRDAATLARIRALAVPPAYTEVWICRDARGHLQATGRDARRRKQYRYHPDWARVRGDDKFARVVAFGRALPALRRRVRTDLALRGLPRAKVLAIAVAVMARTLVRVGNDAYARANGSYGLTTLRNRHVAFLRDGRARFRFRGKSGQAHDVVLDDARLARLLRRCRALPGQALFQYVDDDGAPQPVGSADVNAYLREAMGEAFTAKDVRTWGGTLAAVHALAATPLPASGPGGRAPGERRLAAIERAVACTVADALGNTPAVCRKAYIDPRVFAAWRDGRLHRVVAGVRTARGWERATLHVLDARDGRHATTARSPR